MTESGIYQFLINVHLRFRLERIREESDKSKYDTAEPTQLRMRHLNPVLILLSMGLLPAILAFTIEVGWVKMKGKGKTRSTTNWFHWMNTCNHTKINGLSLEKKKNKKSYFFTKNVTNCTVGFLFHSWSLFYGIK